MEIQKTIDNLSCMKMEIRDMEDIKQAKRIRITTIETAVAALKKQIPVKVDRRLGLKNFNNEVYSIRGDYPVCGLEGLTSSSTNYCNRCGQKLDWN